jgi:hypothetical protein
MSIQIIPFRWKNELNRAILVALVNTQGDQICPKTRRQPSMFLKSIQKLFKKKFYTYLV